MAFSVKDWRNATTHEGGGDETTPISAAALEDLETRLSDYTDLKTPIVIADVAADGATDDRAAVQAAIDATAGEGTVLLPVGTILFDSGTALDLPKDAGGLTIRGAGVGATIVKLTTNCTSMALFNRSADDETFQNISFEDFTIDGNSVATGDGLIGTGTGTANCQRINISGIHVRRVNTINVNAAKGNVMIFSAHPTTDEAGINTIDDIVVEECDFDGGNVGVAVMGSDNGTATSVSVAIGRVLIRNVTHDAGAVPAELGSGANVQLGSLGYGTDTWLVENCAGLHSGDVGYEIDTPLYCVVRDCTSTDQWGAGFLSRNFKTPGELDAQLMVWERCIQYVREQDPSSADNECQAFAPCFGTSPTFGHVILRDCQLDSEATNFTAIAQAVNQIAALKKLTIDGFTVKATSLNDTSAGAQTPSFFWIVPTIDSHLTTRRLRFVIAGATTNATNTPTYMRISAANTKTLTMDMDGFDVDINVTGLASGSDNLIATPVSGTGTVRGRISGIQVRQWAANGVPRVIYFNDAAGGTIADMRCTDWNITSLSSSAAIVRTNDQEDKIIFENCATGEATTVASAASLRLPFTKNFVTISGTDNITSILKSWPGRRVTLTFNNANPGTVTDGSNLKLAGNFDPDADDTITLVCDGTNWYETGRSVN